MSKLMRHGGTIQRFWHSDDQQNLRFFFISCRLKERPSPVCSSCYAPMKVVSSPDRRDSTHSLRKVTQPTLSSAVLIGARLWQGNRNLNSGKQASLSARPNGQVSIGSLRSNRRNAIQHRAGNIHSKATSLWRIHSTLALSVGCHSLLSLQFLTSEV